MNHEHRNILRSNRDILSRSIILEDLTHLLREYKIFNRYMWNDIKTTADMLDALPFRGPKAFPSIIEILRKANYFREADLLERSTSVKGTVDSNLYYVMSSKPLGYCLIINNVEFYKPGSKNESNSQDLPEDRFGSDVDATSLDDLFKEIGFDVTVVRNKAASEMIACLKELSRRDFTNVDSLIIIILSHGGQLNSRDYVLGADNNYVFITDDVIDVFSNRNCTELQNKPKIFFFVCCRGTNMDYGVPKCLPRESIDSNDFIMPSLSDIFVVHSTLPKHYSVRDDGGSYFCQEFITVLREYHQIHDLETMIKLVNKNLQNKVSKIYRTIQMAHTESVGGTKKVMLCKT